MSCTGNATWKGDSGAGLVAGACMTARLWSMEMTFIVGRANENEKQYIFEEIITGICE
jgi:hypothetical protein